MLLISNEKTTGMMLAAWVKKYRAVFPHGISQVPVPVDGKVNIGRHRNVLYQPSSVRLPIVSIRQLAPRVEKVLVLATADPSTWPEVPENVRLERIPSSPEVWLKFFL